MREMKLENMQLGHHQKFRPFSTRTREKKKKNDFKLILDSYLVETADDLEEYNVLLPKHGHFWDNGYEDIG